MKSGAHKFGDWELVDKMIRNMPMAIQQGLDKSLKQVSLKAERLAVKFIQTQELKWKPLSKQYLSRKAQQGLSDKILIATSLYIQSITSKVMGNVGFAGVFRKVRTREGEILADVAKVHEYGSIKRNIPPRRLWGVVFKEMYKFLREEKVVENNVLLEIRRSSGIL